MVVDPSETMLYVACDNQNIYCYGLEAPSQLQEGQVGKNRQKRTLQHKKKVTALCLTVDGQFLISGDSQGLIYVWSTQSHFESLPDSTDLKGSGLITTFELHKDQGSITNLIALHRPLSLFGLTANMNSYEV